MTVRAACAESRQASLAQTLRLGLRPARAAGAGSGDDHGSTASSTPDDVDELTDGMEGWTTETMVNRMAGSCSTKK